MQYYTDYELDPPSREVAISLLSSFNKWGIRDLKGTKGGKQYEFYTAPLVILLKEKPFRTKEATGEIKTSYWKKCRQIISDLSF